MDTGAKSLTGSYVSVPRLAPTAWVLLLASPIV
jgi:hypothetical protein